MKAASHRPSSNGALPLVAFAVDLDRTLLPTDGSGIPAASRVLKAVRQMGLRTVLVSGRELSVLSAFAHRLQYVDALVAENGAVVESPFGGQPLVVGRDTGARVRHRLFGRPWPAAEFGMVVASLPRRLRPRVVPLLKGLGVELVANADRVMILPRGVTKASGMQLALERLHLRGQPYAAIGDGENDLPLLRAAALSAAVRNAHRRVRGNVDYVCRASYGRGVAEFVRGPLRRARRPPALRRPP
jgi:hydroxymethylpyrimidine pyrophosphatase-like HAD family hydrolase